MKTSIIFGSSVFMALTLAASASEIKYPPAPKVSTDPVPIYDGNASPPTQITQSSPPPVATQPLYVYDQKPLQAQPALIAPEQAQGIVERFHTNYSKLENPRILIYVNRELVDEETGMKLSGRSETVTTGIHTNSKSSNTNSTDKTESSDSQSVVKNNYHNTSGKAPTLADRQTVRDVERLMGRPFRSAGATLVDQRTAVQMLGDKPLKDLATGTEGQQAAKDREAINKIADVVIEVLISSRNVTVTELSGDRNYTVPDIQATAIRLKDAKVLGQASAADVMRGSPGYIARTFGVQDVTEATSLSLMDDMLQGIQ